MCKGSGLSKSAWPDRNINCSGHKIYNYLINRKDKQASKLGPFSSTSQGMMFVASFGRWGTRALWEEFSHPIHVRCQLCASFDVRRPQGEQEIYVIRPGLFSNRNDAMCDGRQAGKQASKQTGRRSRP